MKKILFLMLLSVFTISLMANPIGNKASLLKLSKVKVIKQTSSKVFLEVPYKSIQDKQKLNKLWTTFTIDLSCVSITYSGETAQLAIEISLGGGLEILESILDWYWCGGGYEQEHPGDNWV